MDEQTKKLVREVMDSGMNRSASQDSATLPIKQTAMDPAVIEFYHTISESELRSTYLNLANDRRNFGGSFPPHKTKLRIIDGHNRKSFASKHHKNQIWGTIKQWFLDNAVKTGDVVQVRFNDSERDDGYPVVHLTVLRESPSPKTYESEGTARVSDGVATEIPITLEKQIEDFLETNVALIEPGLNLFEAEGRKGRQYPTDVGVIDLLCRDARGEFVVLELKRGRGSDIVVGQISRYMGWVKEHLAGDAQQVRGIILAADADEQMQYAVSANPYIQAKFFRLKLELLDTPPD